MEIQGRGWGVGGGGWGVGVGGGWWGGGVGGWGGGGEDKDLAILPGFRDQLLNICVPWPGSHTSGEIKISIRISMRNTCQEGKVRLVYIRPNLVTTLVA